MKVRQLFVASLLSLGVCAAAAQMPGAGPGKGPGLSAEEKEKRCQANPEKCAQIKENVEKRRDENQARREEFKKKCDADPKACEAKKAQIKEKMEERREQRQEHREGMKGRMQNAPRPPAK
ncbi:MAG: hypothetical protein Q7J42_12010 [Sulfuritalea sp.]|nr:hypothetical protein [Sulfuritalea sp.]